MGGNIETIIQRNETIIEIDDFFEEQRFQLQIGTTLLVVGMPGQFQPG
jgi:hypothetical protein